MATDGKTQKARRLALITGASGGIGEAFAGILAEEGWDLVLVARNEDELRRVAGVLQAATDTTAHVLPFDLAQAGAGGKLIKALQRRGWMPEVLINNAGFGLNGRAMELDVDRQLRMIDLNVRTLTELSLRLLPQMIARGAGGVLNVASTAGFMSGPHMAVYFATKAYVLHFSEALAEEARGSKVTVTALCPGPVKTGFQETAGMSDGLLMKLMPAARAKDVARAGWQGFKEGRAVVVPGAMNWLAAQMPRLLPRAVVRKANGWLFRPKKD